MPIVPGRASGAQEARGGDVVDAGLLGGRGDAIGLVLIARGGAFDRAHGAIGLDRPGAELAEPGLGEIGGLVDADLFVLHPRGPGIGGEGQGGGERAFLALAGFVRAGHRLERGDALDLDADRDLDGIDLAALHAERGVERSHSAASSSSTGGSTGSRISASAAKAAGALPWSFFPWLISASICGASATARSTSSDEPAL
jgi:hypothetical protein